MLRVPVYLARVRPYHGPVKDEPLRTCPHCGGDLERTTTEFYRALDHLGEVLGSTHDRGAIVNAILDAATLIVRPDAAHSVPIPVDVVAVMRTDTV